MLIKRVCILHLEAVQIVILDKPFATDLHNIGKLRGGGSCADLCNCLGTCAKKVIIAIIGACSCILIIVGAIYVAGREYSSGIPCLVVGFIGVVGAGVFFKCCQNYQPLSSQDFQKQGKIRTDKFEKAWDKRTNDLIHQDKVSKGEAMA